MSSPERLPNMLCHSNSPRDACRDRRVPHGATPAPLGWASFFRDARNSPRAYPLGQGLGLPALAEPVVRLGNGLFITVGSDRIDRHCR